MHHASQPGTVPVELGLDSQEDLPLTSSPPSGILSVHLHYGESLVSRRLDTYFRFRRMFYSRCNRRGRTLGFEVYYQLLL